MKYFTKQQQQKNNWKHFISPKMFIPPKALKLMVSQG